MQELSGFKIGLAVFLAALVASSSFVISVKLITSEEKEEQGVECTGVQIQTDEGCIDPVPELPKPEDCTFTEMWRDGNCDEMITPSNLTYVVETLQWRIGENHTLTPSFDGDGPETWSVFPEFPSFMILDEESGEIIASPLQEHEDSTHTVIAANNAGMTTTNLTLSVINIAPLFHYFHSLANALAGQKKLLLKLMANSQSQILNS